MIRETLETGQSKAKAEAICKWIGNDDERFAELMALFLSDEYRMVQRSAWVLSKVGERYPHLLEPYLPQLIGALREPLHSAVQRNVLKVLADTEIPVPEELEGPLVDQSFELLADPKVPVAIRVHAMQLLANLCRSYPELGIELKAIIEDNMEHGSAGFRSRGRKVLKAIEKLT